MRVATIAGYESALHGRAELALLYTFLLMLPFVYAFQVISGVPEAGLLGYIPLLFLIAVVARNYVEYWTSIKSTPKVLLLLVLSLAFHNVVSALSILGEGDAAIAGRALVLFSIPAIVFVVGGQMSIERHWSIVKLVALTAAIVALEMLWEDFTVWILRESTWFQLRNFHYVLSVTGRELNQLWAPGYRTTGLIEHVHASTFYLVIGFVAAMAVFLRTGAITYLAVAVICELTIIVHGVRFPLIVAALAASVYIVCIRYAGAALSPPRLRIVVIVCGVAAIAAVVLDPFGTVRRFFLPVLFDGIWNTDAPDEFTLQSVLHSGVNNAKNTVLGRLTSEIWSLDCLQGLFGHGIANSLKGSVEGLDDDFFVAQIFAQYGLLGGLAFYAIFVVALVQSARSLRHIQDDRMFLIAFVIVVLVVIGGSTLHSGVVQRKAIFGILMWVLSIAYACQTLRPQRVGSR